MTYWHKFAFTGFLAPLLVSAYPAPLGQSIEPGSLTGSTGEVLDVDEDRSRRMTIPVNIEGQGPFSFVIDTGAERTVLSKKVASKLKLEEEEPAQLVSIAGQTTVDMVYVPKLTLGSKSYESLISPVLLERHIGAEGILGLDGLQEQRILFNFIENKIFVEDAEKKRGRVSSREIVVTARRRSGQLIYTDAMVAGVKTNVIIDTGAQVSIANSVLKKRIQRQKRQTGVDNLLIAVTGDTLGVEFGRARDFRMGRARFDSVLVAFADAPPFEQFGMKNKPAILLGMDILRQFDQVAIDFPKRKIHFLPPRHARAIREEPRNSRIKK